MKRNLVTLVSGILGYLFNLWVYPIISINKDINALVIIAITCIIYYFLSGILFGNKSIDSYILLIGTVLWIYVTFYSKDLRLLYPEESDPKLYFYMFSSVLLSFITIIFLPIKRLSLNILFSLLVAGVMSYTQPRGFNYDALIHLLIGVIFGYLAYGGLFLLKADRFAKRMMKYTKR